MIEKDDGGPTPARPAPDREILARLRRRIGLLERGRGRSPGETLPTGCRTLDGVLPGGGFSRRALHEVTGPAATAFAAALALRALAGGGRLLWCLTDAGARRRGTPYLPGLVGLGLDHRRLLLVRCPDERELLRTMEEALRCPAVACVLGECERLGPTADRRLQLAAERGGGIALLLGGVRPDPVPLAAATRVRAAPFFLPGRRIFRLDLWRVRGGTPWRGMVEWDERTRAFAVAAGIPDRTVAPGRAATG